MVEEKFWFFYYYYCRYRGEYSKKFMHLGKPLHQIRQNLALQIRPNQTNLEKAQV